MPNNQITSLQSPHVVRVKALLGYRGKKIRATEREFIADGLQSVREVLSPTFDDAPALLHLYVTEKGYAKLHGCYGNLISGYIDEGIQELTGL